MTPLSTPLPLDDRIDLICDRFEATWKANSPIGISELLKEFSTDERPRLLRELLAIEIERRFSRKETISKVDYLAVWSAYQSIVNAVFDETVDVWKKTTLPSHTNIRIQPVVANEEPRKDQDPPMKIGKYAIIEALDHGGQATVYRAIHPELRRDVVIKFCHFDRISNARLAGSMADEGRVLASLNHPNLAKVFDFDFLENRPYLVMEFVSGLNLSQYRKQRNPSTGQWIPIVRKIAEALDYVHQQGVVHLDIKPQNILIDQSDMPRLIDFGLSRAETAWSQSGPDSTTLCGTIQYMPPEQAQCDTEKVGPKSDIFSLGGVIYFLATGQPPIEGRDLQECIRKAQAGDWNRERLAECEVGIVEIIKRAMSNAPEDRYANAGELAAALKRLEVVSSLNKAAKWIMFAASFLVGLGAIGISQIGIQEAPSVATTGMNIRVWRDEAIYSLTDTAPVSTGDRIEVTSDIPAGQHVSLFLFDSDGKLTLIDSKPAANATFTYRFPQDPSHFEQIVGSSGTEFVFLCRRRDRAMSIDDLNNTGLFGDAWPTLPNASILQVRPVKVEYLQRDRGFGGGIETIDPQQQVFDQLDLVRKTLLQQGTGVEGIAFSHTE